VGIHHRHPSLEPRNVAFDSGGCPQMRSSSQDDQRSSTPPQRRIPDSSNASSTAKEIPSGVYSQVVQALLDQHPRYTESGLMQYLADCHPEIPAEHRRALIIGAVTGAQRGAQHHFLVKYNESSYDPVRRRRAEKAGCKLSYWNFGLRSETSTLPPFPMTSVFDNDED